MRKVLLAFIFLLLFFISGIADEGMWMLSLLQQLNITKMTDMGLKLTAEDIYSINKSSLKDAIVLFDRGCTGEMVSAEGLLFTNHHCGFDAIQSHSSVDHDYLANGFWAASAADELPNPDMKVTFLIKITDVTTVILSQVNDTLKEYERNSLIENIITSIEEDSVKGTKYKASVVSFYGGNEYYLFFYQTFNDVRLVGAPPESIGKFGGETDNWMWPRQTGDFSIFRVYCAPDGSPAEYSKNNVSYKPKYFLPVSLKGIQKGDFTMVMGYPYTTDRFLSSYGIKELFDITDPIRIEVRTIRQDILKDDMDKDPAIKIKYAYKYSESCNYWKNAIGEKKGLAKYNIYAKKQAFEKEFTDWVDLDSIRIRKYGNALDLIKSSYEGRLHYQSTIHYLYEGIIRSIETVGFVKPFEKFSDEIAKDNPDTAKINKWLRDEKRLAIEFYKNINFPTEEKVATAMLKLLSNKIDKEYQPEIFKDIKEKYKDDYEKYVKKLYSTSIFTDSARLFSFLKHPDSKRLKKDLFFKFTLSFYSKLREEFFGSSVFSSDQEKGERLFIAGIREMNKNVVFYPDANFTMRLSYGTVSGYSPSDAVKYDYFTTLKGVIEKENPENEEFIVPEKLKDLYNQQDYKPYSLSENMPVCFITDNDITGGNSGSPVLNAEGQLIGLAFDGNWEALIGNEYYDADLQKCICVDIRYVLFIIDKYAGARQLINELTIVR